MIEELNNYGIKIDEKARDLITGLDRNLTYWKISKAIEIILRGGRHWVCGNSQFFRFGDKLLPGERAISESIRSITGKNYEILGKPSEYSRKIFLKEFKIFPDETIMISDDLETDIKFGNLLGLRTGLILGGQSKKEDLRKLPKEELPSFVFRDIRRVLMKIE